MPGGEDQAVLDPSVPGPGLVGVLLLLPHCQSSDAQNRQWEGRFGRVGFDLTKHEPAADPLELLFDVQLGGVEVHVIPGQAEDFAFAQAENEDQDEGGVASLDP